MTVEVSGSLTKKDINLEIKRLRALQNQHRSERDVFSQYQIEIEQLTKKRDRLISNSRSTFLTGFREKLHQAGVVFDATHRERKDID